MCLYSHFISSSYYFYKIFRLAFGKLLGNEFKWFIYKDVFKGEKTVGEILFPISSLFQMNFKVGCYY